MPLLHPSSLQEVLDFGILGWAMARYSSCWVGLKLLPETVNSTACIDIGLDRHNVVLPDVSHLPGNRNIRWPDPWPDFEKRIIRAKLPPALSGVGRLLEAAGNLDAHVVVQKVYAD